MTDSAAREKLRYALQLTGAYMKGVITLPLLLYSLYASLAVVAMYLEKGRVLGVCQDKCVIEKMVPPITMITGALVFLLVFRQNLCYARWWSGRKIWGSLAVSALNLGRHAAIYMGNCQETIQIVHWAIAYMVVVLGDVRNNKEYKLIQDVLSEGEILAISTAREPIGYVTLRLGDVLMNAIQSEKMSDLFLKNLDRFLSDLENQCDLSDGILNTPMPFAYTSHARTFIFAWLGMLPFALFYHLHWFTIPSCVILGYCVIGLEYIATNVENPFGDDDTDIDLDSIVTNAKKTLLGFVQNLDRMEKEADSWSGFRKRGRDGRTMWRAESDRTRVRSSAPVISRSISARIGVGWTSLFVFDE
ncbi:hypothetical protein BSKO_12080 [Bryopsis sp. KO-2023]|nr:hypothetical protein BSKO_12080 [Bryopsis sp. KO-2023]